MKINFLVNSKISCSDMREGKGGALLGLAFFSQPQKAGAGDRPDRGTPKEILFLSFFEA